MTGGRNACWHSVVYRYSGFPIREAAGYGGNFLAPLKIIMTSLSVAAIVWPAGPINRRTRIECGAFLTDL
ncbi:hypothetical protein KCP73_05830 [Salmonella enterica subsp. enterica]|nr:hypothetical protein KCP73_05830 [Salmonella enterica subsp. enterica]